MSSRLAISGEAWNNLKVLWHLLVRGWTRVNTDGLINLASKPGLLYVMQRQEQGFWASKPGLYHIMQRRVQWFRGFRHKITKAVGFSVWVLKPGAELVRSRFGWRACGDVVRVWCILSELTLRLREVEEMLCASDASSKRWTKSPLCGLVSNFSTRGSFVFRFSTYIYSRQLVRGGYI